MNRRGFLKALCAVATTPVVAALLPLAIVEKARSMQDVLVVYYDNKFVDTLRTNVNYRIEMTTSLPPHTGQRIRLTQYQPLPAKPVNKTMMTTYLVGEDAVISGEKS